ncbi:MAG: hypothetical protein JRI23_10455, partial [Deltaproteobacteria bacterium]|nr:hypothetical protein [Deltaproteobacteria bacterium]MBW2532092.1 hypothetical protein [Deltaproteobacteria bacterium]
MTTDEGPRSDPAGATDGAALTGDEASEPVRPLEEGIPADDETPEDLKKTLRRAPTDEIEELREAYRARQRAAGKSDDDLADADTVSTEPDGGLPPPKPPPKRPAASQPPRAGNDSPSSPARRDEPAGSTQPSA